MINETTKQENGLYLFTEGYRRNEAATTHKKVDEAEYWFKKAVEADYTLAITMLGELCIKRSLISSGKLTKKAKEGAAFWYEAAALRGEVHGMSNLAFFYGTGLGFKYNEDKAMHWLGKALEIKDSFLFGDTGKIGYRLVVLSRTEGVETGLPLRSKPIDEMTNQELMYGAFGLLRRGYPNEAKVNFQRLAELGETSALLNLGLISDCINESMEWFAKAADKGNALAMALLAEAYIVKEPFLAVQNHTPCELSEHDIDQALYGYGKAAAMGEFYAKENLNTLQAILHKTNADPAAGGSLIILKSIRDWEGKGKYVKALLDAYGVRARITVNMGNDANEGYMQRL
jgi:TPR repeat protein